MKPEEKPPFLDLTAMVAAALQRWSEGRLPETAVPMLCVALRAVLREFEIHIPWEDPQKELRKLLAVTASTTRAAG